MPAVLFDLVGEFLGIVAIVYGVTAAVYFAAGFAFTWLNARHPERRIQRRTAADRAGLEIRHSLRALIVVALCFGGGVFAQRQGWALAPVPLEPWSAVGLFVVSVVLHDAWFYLGHRLLHTRTLIRWHRLHHSCVTPSVWSNDCFTTLDIFSQHVYFLIAPFILPLPLEVLIAHRLYDQLKGMSGHAGYEYFAGRLTRWPFPFACTHFHDFHHANGRFNFANTFTIWDRIFGTVDPGYDRLVRDYQPAETPRPAGSAMSGKGT